MIGAVLRMPESVASGCLVLIDRLTSLVRKLVKPSYRFSVIFENSLLHVLRPLTIGKVVFSFIKNNKPSATYFEQGLTNATSRASYRLLSF